MEYPGQDCVVVIRESRADVAIIYGSHFLPTLARFCGRLHGERTRAENLAGYARFAAVAEAERRQAKHDIRSVEAILLSSSYVLRDAGVSSYLC